MVKKLDDKQIKKIESLIKTAGFEICSDGIDGAGGSARLELSTYHRSDFILISFERYDVSEYGYIEVLINSASGGSLSIQKTKEKVKNMNLAIKLATKIEKVIREK